MAFVMQHKMAGQVYNHWGRHDLDAELDPKAVADMLAMRVSYAPVKEEKSAAKQESPAEPIPSARCAGTTSKLSDLVAADSCRHVQASIDLNDAALTSHEVRQAEKAYARAVLAEAGELEMGPLVANPKKRTGVTASKKRTAQQQLMKAMKQRR
jgi:hypothetical protein